MKIKPKLNDVIDRLISKYINYYLEKHGYLEHFHMKLILHKRLRRLNLKISKQGDLVEEDGSVVVTNFTNFSLAVQVNFLGTLSKKRSISHHKSQCPLCQRAQKIDKEYLETLQQFCDCVREAIKEDFNKATELLICDDCGKNIHSCSCGLSCTGVTCSQCGQHYSDDCETLWSKLFEVDNYFSLSHQPPLFNDPDSVIPELYLNMTGIAGRIAKDNINKIKIAKWSNLTPLNKHEKYFKYLLLVDSSNRVYHYDMCTFQDITKQVYADNDRIIAYAACYFSFSDRPTKQEPVLTIATENYYYFIAPPFAREELLMNLQEGSL